MQIETADPFKERFGIFVDQDVFAQTALSSSIDLN